jgi:hypothetical protein
MEALMTTTIDQAADLYARQQIVDLFTRYANALDAKRWGELDELFTEDVSARWLKGKWIQHNRADMIAFIRSFLEPVPTHHMLGNHLVSIAGDVAAASCHVRGHHQGIGERQHLYQETLGIFTGTAVRLDGAWRFSEWSEEALIVQGTFEIFDQP